MAIEILFPCLDEPKEEPTAVAPVTTQDAAPKPFALSNAAFEAKQESAPVPSVERRLSPAIEKALAEVEAREEQQRLRKISRSSRGSGAASGTPSPLASRDQSRNGTDVEATTFERRVFTRARSPSPEPESLAGAEAERDVQDPEPTTQSPSPVPEQMHENVQRPIATPARSRASSVLSHLSSTQSASASNGFKARPAPPSSSKPAIQPRMTKAAALRLGIALPPATPRRSTTLNGPSPAAVAAAPTPQASRATPRSLGQPAITPRLTKAAALRLGQPDPSAATSLTTTPRVRQSISTAERAALDRARRQSALGTATSTTTTTTRGAKVVEVRMSRAALLRQGLDASAPPPSSVNRAKGVITAGRASLSSSMSGPSTAAASGRPSTTGPGLGPVSADLKALREPAIAPRMTKAASLRTGGGGAGAKGAAAGRPSLLLASSSLANARATSSSAGAGGSATAAAAAGDRNSRPASTTGGSLSSSASASASRPASSAFAGPRKSLSVSKATTTTAAPPTLTPRLNKAAELRKAKLQETVAAAVGPRGSTGTAPPPRKGKTLTERN